MKVNFSCEFALFFSRSKNYNSETNKKSKRKTVNWKFKLQPIDNEFIESNKNCTVYLF